MLQRGHAVHLVEYIPYFQASWTLWNLHIIETIADSIKYVEGILVIKSWIAVQGSCFPISCWRFFWSRCCWSMSIGHCCTFVFPSRPFSVHRSFCSSNSIALFFPVQIGVFALSLDILFNPWESDQVAFVSVCYLVINFNGNTFMANAWFLSSVRLCDYPCFVLKINYKRIKNWVWGRDFLKREDFL